MVLIGILCNIYSERETDMLNDGHIQICYYSLGKLAIFFLNPKQIATQMFFAFL